MAGDALALAGLAAALIGAGALIGVILGALGAGGGAAVAPLLFAVFTSLDYPPSGIAHGTVATALGVIAVLSGRALASRERRRAIDARLLRAMAPFAVLGAVAAALAAVSAPPRALLALAGVGVGLAALQIALRPIAPGAFGAQGPSGPLAALLGFGSGAVSGVAGVGGGAARPLLEATGAAARPAGAVAAGVGLAAAASGAIVYAALGPDWPEGPPLNVGSLNLLAVALIAPAAILTSPIGARVSHALTLRPFEILVGLFLIASAFVMLRAALLGVGA